MTSYTRNLELYEYTRADSRTTQNRKRLSSMPIGTRSQLLLDAGYTREQIIQRVF